jgi:energy-converting hydrogenase Eha subunit E
MIRSFVILLLEAVVGFALIGIAIMGFLNYGIVLALMGYLACGAFFSAGVYWLLKALIRIFRNPNK